MINKKSEFLQPKSITHKVLSLASIYLISKILLNSAEYDVRIKVRERAKGKCEGCRQKVHYKLIVAHINHTRDKNYNNVDKLKAYCVVCEFKHHANHMGKAKKIGLNETHNTYTVKILWRRILKKEKKIVIKKLYKRYNRQIRQMYIKYHLNLSQLKQYR